MIYYPILCKYASLQLKKASETCKSVKDYLDLASNFKIRVTPRGSSICLSVLQVKEEIEEFLRIAMRIRPKNTLEIGTGSLAVPFSLFLEWFQTARE